MNNFTLETIGFKTNSVYHSDTDSLYIEEKSLGCITQN